MTKRKADPVAWELKWIDQRTGKELGKSIHAAAKPWDDNIFAAAIEQFYTLNGPTAVADFLSTRLRHPSPPRALLNLVARLLDPQDNFSFKLVVERRRSGKSWTKHVNDAAIAEAILRSQQKLGRKRLSKKEVGDIADQFEISDAKVRKVKSQIRK
jgi:hypothetical protein